VSLEIYVLLRASLEIGASLVGYSVSGITLNPFHVITGAFLTGNLYVY